MEESGWRVGAKIVAIFDIIIFCINLLAVILLAVLYVAFYTGFQDHLKKELGNESENGSIDSPAFRNAVWGGDVSDESLDALDYEAVSRLMNFLNSIAWTLIVLWTICSLVRLWAAVKLLAATDITLATTNPAKSLRMAAIWKNISLVFLIMDIIVGLLTNLYIYTAVPVIVRMIFLFLVMAFMKELRYFISVKQDRGSRQLDKAEAPPDKDAVYL